MLFHSSPQYDELRIFGSLCYPCLRSHAPNKFAPRSTKCVFLGYSKIHKGYFCLNLLTKKIIVSRHVIFAEQVFPFKDDELVVSNPRSSVGVSSNSSPFYPILLRAIHSLSLSTHPTVPIRNQSHPPPTSNPSPTLPPLSPSIPDLSNSSPSLSSVPTVPSILTLSPDLSTHTISPPQPSPTNQHPMITRSKTGSLKLKTFHFVSSLQIEPTTYAQAAK